MDAASKPVKKGGIGSNVIIDKVSSKHSLVEDQAEEEEEAAEEEEEEEEEALIGSNSQLVVHDSLSDPDVPNVVPLEQDDKCVKKVNLQCQLSVKAVKTAFKTLEGEIGRASCRERVYVLV